MDETATDAETSYRRHGFEDQRLCVVPGPQVEAALQRPGTRRLVVTDAGYFPSARGHRRFRPKGAPETIVILCVAGSGFVHVDGERRGLTAGMWTAILPSARHEYGASERDPWTIWWLHARGTDAAELVRPMVGDTPPVPRLRSLDRVLPLFDELVSLLEGRLSPAHLLAASGVAWNLLARMSADTVLPGEGSALERAMRYLEARVEGRITVPELAALAGVSPSHLTALFRESTGGGPGAFHTSLKMARARRLLDTTSISIGEVGAAVGYADPLYFSRHFRGLHGVSPREYRAKSKG